jgi:alcohol dehydrogenase YqhD (iron-dependent ADH family)
LLVAGKRIIEFGGIMANPTLTKVLEGVEIARDEGVDFIIAIGGGSVMDCSKAISLGAVEDDIWEKHWVRFEPIEVTPLPLGIVVTASGTGSEGNGGAVITNEETKVKTGKDFPELNAHFAILDPELTFTVPPTQTIAGAYDSLSHMMEEYFSLPIGDNLADDLLETCMRAVIRNLPKAIADPEDYKARANLEWASSLAENRLLKSGKATCFQCHMIEHQIGAYTGCVHGLGLAAFTADYYRRIFDKTPEALRQFKRFAVNVWGADPTGKTDEEVVREGIEALEAWTREVGAHRSLSDLGLREDQIEEVAQSITILPTALAPLSREELVELMRDNL